MQEITEDTLLKAGVQYGHLAKNWHPSIRKFLFMKRDGRHFINIDQTQKQLVRAGKEMKKLAEAGKKILFVGSKKQAKIIVETAAQRIKQPYVTKRWLGGALTNFATIKKLLRKLILLERHKEKPEYMHLTKKEKLIIDRKKKKLEILLRGMADLKRLPAAIFVVDVNKEHTAVKEANKLNIPVVAIVDTNAPTRFIDYPIPGNDDAFESIRVLVNYIADSIAEGQAVWEAEKAKQKTAIEKASKEDGKKTLKRIKTTKESLAESKKVSQKKNPIDVTKQKKEVPVATPVPEKVVEADPKAS